MSVILPLVLIVLKMCSPSSFISMIWLGICHNGNLANARALRKRLEEQGAIFHSSSDTSLSFCIRHSQAETFEGKLQEGLNQLRGGFTYLIVTKDAYGAVDQHALRHSSSWQDEKWGLCCRQ